MSAAAAPGVSPASIEAVQRTGAEPFRSAAGGPVTSAPPPLRRLLRVDGVSYTRRPGADDLRGGQGLDVPTESMLVALAGAAAPVALALDGTPGRVTFTLGTWAADYEPAAVDHRMRLLSAALRGVYPAVDAAPGEMTPIRWPMGGLALGVPTVEPPDSLDGTLAVDRLVRAMGDMRWAVVLLAEPLVEAVLSARAHRIINELRAVASFEQAARVPSPLARYYSDLLQRALEILTRSQSIGGWRAAAYLLGDEVSYPCLASAWRAIHAGAASLPEPVRVFDGDEAVGLAARWALPDAAGDDGGLAQPYACQTILSSRELAGLVQLPRVELPGFSIRVTAAFDVVPPLPGGEGLVSVGNVVHRERVTAGDYAVTTRSLTRHVFVAGVTGSGKTNTILHLLAGAAAAGTPFLVIEPAKTEYRVLLDHPELGPRLRVFTPGRERVSPLRLNPFEVPTGIDVAEHLDLLRAVFAASFVMWGPLPQVLERSLQEVYADRGWDLRTNHNHRLGDEPPSARAFPTLTDFTEKVQEVVTGLGYEPRTTDDIRAALLTRLDSLRSGGKGAMLDVSRSIPMEELLGAPTVIELEGVGDDDDKAFLIGLLLVRLAEHRRAAGLAQGLTHLLVVEEAHRLLTAETRGATEYVADPRGGSVETFTNLLSEIRAYGQGVLIADQVPVRLAPDVIKNTNLKIAHRIVAADDREVLGGTMAMSDPQTRYVSTLGTGRAAVFSEGDDAPVLVAVPRVKNGAAPPADARVTEAMARRGLGGLSDPRPFCAQTCAGEAWACRLARELLEDPAVQDVVARVALATAEHAEALDRLWPDVVGAVRARRAADSEEAALLRAFAGHAADWLTERRGAQNGWSYGATEGLADALRAVLLEKAAGGSGDSPARDAFQVHMRELHRREFDPYPACGRICAHAPLCLYRAAAAEVVRSRRYHETWAESEAADAKAGDGMRRPGLWNTAWSAAYELVEMPHGGLGPEEHAAVDGAARRAALCFAQQMAAGDRRNVPSTARWLVDRVLDEAGVS